VSTDTILVQNEHDCASSELLATEAGILADEVVGELVLNDVACELSELLAAVAGVLAELLATEAGILADEVVGELVPNDVACELSNRPWKYDDVFSLAFDNAVFRTSRMLCLLSDLIASIVWSSLSTCFHFHEGRHLLIGCMHEICW